MEGLSENSAFIMVSIQERFVIINYKKANNSQSKLTKHTTSAKMRTACCRRAEYVSKIDIFGLKMMVKSGLSKIILKVFHEQNYFPYFIKLPKIINSVTKISFFVQGRVSKKCTYHK